MHKFRWVSLHWSEHNKIICNKRSRAKYCWCDSNPQNTQTCPLRVLADCWSIKEATDRLTDRLVIAELANTTTLAAAIHCPLLDLSTSGDRRWWEKADTKNTKVKTKIKPKTITLLSSLNFWMYQIHQSGPQSLFSFIGVLKSNVSQCFNHFMKLTLNWLAIWIYKQ